jgi:hypothetical protein
MCLAYWKTFSSVSSPDTQNVVLTSTPQTAAMKPNTNQRKRRQ